VPIQCHYLLALGGLDDIGITRVGDAKAANSEVFTASSTELDVVSAVVVDAGLAQHGVVLDFGLSESRRVLGQNDELSFGGSELFESLAVAEAVFTRLHDELKSRVDSLGSVLGLFGHVVSNNLYRFVSDTKIKQKTKLKRHALTPPTHLRSEDIVTQHVSGFSRATNQERTHRTQVTGFQTG